MGGVTIDVYEQGNKPVFYVLVEKLWGWEMTPVAKMLCKHEDLWGHNST